MLDYSKLDYNKPILVEELGDKRIYASKSLFKPLKADQYFLKLYDKNDRGDFMNLGYIYFGIDYSEMSSSFIGTYIKPNYRNKGLSKLLISYWIKTCLDNNIRDLKTIKKQRKPLILYMLKGFTFDIEDQSRYNDSKHTIYVCKNPFGQNDPRKFLLFKDQAQEQTFINSPIAYEDNYDVLSSVDSDKDILDEIILNSYYELRNDTEAYMKAEEQISKFKK